jgi:hypothetical protein
MNELPRLGNVTYPFPLSLSCPSPPFPLSPQPEPLLPITQTPSLSRVTSADCSRIYSVATIGYQPAWDERGAQKWRLRPNDDHRHSIIKSINVTNPLDELEWVQPNSQSLFDIIRYLAPLLLTAEPYRRPINQASKPETNSMAQERKLGVAVLGIGRMGKRHALNVRSSRSWLNTTGPELDDIAHGGYFHLDSILLP